MSGDTAQAAPQPDPAISDAAKKQAELGQQWLDFSKEQFGISQQRQAQLDDLTKQVSQKQLAAADQQLGYAQQDRDRYNTVYKPIEDKFVAEASNYATPERQAEAAAEAKADVTTQAATQRAASERQAIGLGLRPDSGRFEGIDRSAELGTAALTAGAVNTARQGVRDKGLALEGQLVNLGKGLPVQASSETSLGLNAGASAVGLNQSNQNLSNAATGIVGAGYQGASSGYGQEASTLSNLYSNSLNAWNSKQQSDAQESAGIGGALGNVAGLVLGGASAPWWLSSEELKTDKSEIPDGEALSAIEGMPVERWRYKDGVADGGSHIGPYAEDFQRQTGHGNGKAIPAQDAVGITMRAVQDLTKEVRRIEKAIGLGSSSKPAAKAGPAKAPAPAPKTIEGTARKVAPPPKPVGIGIKRAA